MYYGCFIIVNRKDGQKHMKGFKVFNSDWTCKGFQFEVGKTFTEDVIPECCDRWILEAH